MLKPLSGWGAFSLLARNPGVFARAALWDAPTMLGRPFCDWLVAGAPAGRASVRGGAGGDLWGMMGVFGDCATWGKYSPFELVSAPSPAIAGLGGRLWLGGQHYFGDWPAEASRGGKAAPGSPFNHTVDFHARLAAHGVAHGYDDGLDPGRHQWSWLWMRPALDSLLPPADGTRTR